VKQAGGGGLLGSVVEVASTVANVQHMPGRPTIVLRSDKATDGWTVVCAPLGGTLPNPDPTDGESLAVRGYVKRVDTEMAMVFGRQIVLDPCLVLQ
jgi:hypothetical protein